VKLVFFTSDDLVNFASGNTVNVVTESIGNLGTVSLTREREHPKTLPVKVL